MIEIKSPGRATFDSTIEFSPSRALNGFAFHAHRYYISPTSTGSAHAFRAAQSQNFMSYDKVQSLPKGINQFINFTA